MDIVVLTSSFPRYENDAAGRFVYDLSRGLSELGHSVHHVVPDAGASQTISMPHGLTLKTFNIGPGNWGGALAFGSGMGANLKSRPWLAAALPSLLRGFRKSAEAVIAELDSPLLLSHWAFPAGLVASKLARKHNLRHVGVVHGGGLQALTRTPFGKRWLNRWARGLDGALFVSEDLKKKAERSLGQAMPDRSMVSPMGIDAGRFDSESGTSNWRKKMGLGEGGLLLAGAGRLIELKGFDLLIRAAADLDDASVVIAGVGPEQDQLSKLAAKLSVHVRFAGQLAPTALGQLYRESDLLVIPSRLGPNGRSEGSPMVALEAMSQGLPFVASTTGGLTALAEQSGAGATFRVNDCHDLAETLRNISMDGERRLTMKNKGLHFAQSHAYSVVANRLENLLF